VDFEPTPKMREMQARLTEFMDAHIYPAEPVFARHFETTDTPFRTPDFYEDLKAKARAAGLWNLFRPKAHGGDLSNLEYAPLAEIMGRVWWAPEIFNCNAPDTGNMETLMLYGSEAQKARWLTPLLAGTCPTWNTRRWPRSWAGCGGLPRYSTATRRTRAIWKP